MAKQTPPNPVCSQKALWMTVKKKSQNCYCKNVKTPIQHSYICNNHLFNSWTAVKGLVIVIKGWCIVMKSSTQYPKTVGHRWCIVLSSYFIYRPRLHLNSYSHRLGISLGHISITSVLLPFYVTDLKSYDQSWRKILDD